ncbi:hypothetical protein A3G55_02710 [Candidatus Giovannonibacteria bacterium RIFCSPLOWO2_12_FULL_44_25]|uniref:Uncharacterized protein n=4 Tax=Parcubacteria group TaxID=1794811 RepID=A0A837IHE4_9BACT|nr:MAG: hypothetical protein UW15_C0014G0007 [Parcubacteria group bacterium GW2011_GWC1_44_10]KKT57063.1 MAG: hypothetical protein UW49_C0008G0025 [Candidatus Giovannonibacteria bacterium GW2011_GWB1_44_23]KKT59500.1 MAG: hypothetical protein UW53_C0011G0029 [Candidatus Giovannonibacteria bacterium GW2011_GWA1_44_25]KKU13035.1 MAG: hypothetical protein UX18_C0003G0003 [Candidatus Azambacteria bacterium GW2011_GWC2_45_7b]OGF49948.1 MAG: hypothetical protein A2120_04535 [Candidatus Giovannonibact
MPKEITNDELARMIAKGFDDMGNRFKETASKTDTEHLKLRVDHIDATLSVMSRDVADIKKHFVYRDEFEDLMARVKYLETKLDVESGK